MKVVKRRPSVPHDDVADAGSASSGAAVALAGEMLQAVLDSLMSRIAVIDQTGDVLMTNRAWKRFAEEHGNVDPDQNYLAVCQRAEGDPHAARTLAGLRDLLDGTSDEFCLEYPCHSPVAQQWSVLRATRYTGPGEARVVIAHEDITARVSSERELAQARNHFAAATDSMGEGLFTLDVDGRLTFLNAAGEQLLGWRRDEIDQRVMHEVTHFRRADGSLLPVDQCPIIRARRDGVVVRVDDDVFIRRDGSVLPVSYTAAPFSTDDGIDGCVVVFEDISERKRREAHLERDAATLATLGRIRAALDEDRLVLYAQPIVDLRTGESVQQELLIRMRDADGIIVPPGEFLPVAEQYGLIGDIDRWVISQATTLAAAGTAVELNVSAQSIGDPLLLEHIGRCLATSRADPKLLVFEVTETALVQDEHAAQRFAEHVRALGCRLALDDFGTGYGGFTYLKRLPVDILKIDMEFVRDLIDNPSSRHVVEAVVALAESFELTTVAEGVEDAATLDLLGALGVDHAQGFYIARPAPLEETTG